MGCFGSRELDLQKVNQYYAYGYDQAEYAYLRALDARVHYNLNQDHGAIDDLITGLINLHYACMYILGRYEDFYPEFALVHVVEEHTVETATLDMAGIIDAMYDATPLEYQYFIGYVDAYRANMWNLPFYESWHAMLARHFSE